MKKKKLVKKKPVAKKKVTKKKVYGWKKSKCNKLIKLSFPADVKFVRNHEIVEHNDVECRKHRASHAYVVHIEHIKSKKRHKKATASRNNFVYHSKKMVYPDYFEPAQIACSHGIHFFDTKKEARAYKL